MPFCNDFSFVLTVDLGVGKTEEKLRGHHPSKLFTILPRKAGKMLNGHSQEADILTSNFPALLSNQFIHTLGLVFLQGCLLSFGPHRFFQFF